MSQIEKVKYRLEVDGRVTRNWALQNYISRLSAIIKVLKNMGYAIKGKKEGTDYVYTLSGSPENTPKTPVKVEYEKVLRNGEWVVIKREYHA